MKSLSAAAFLALTLPAAAQTPLVDHLAASAQLPQPHDYVVDCGSAGRAAWRVAHARNIGMPIDQVLALHEQDARAGGEPAYLQHREEKEIFDLYAHPQISADEARAMATRNCGWVALPGDPLR